MNRGIGIVAAVVLAGVAWLAVRQGGRIGQLESELAAARRQAAGDARYIERLTSPTPQQQVGRRDEEPADDGEAAPDEHDALPAENDPLAGGRNHYLTYGTKGSGAPTVGTGSSKRLSVSDVAALQDEPPLEATAFAVEARLESPQGSELILGNAEAEAGATIRLEAIAEFPYPTKYDPPMPIPTAFNAQSPAIAPQTPANFRTVETGWVVEAVAEPAGLLVALSGVARQVVFDGFQEQPGEYTGPIVDGGTVLTDNARIQPRFTTRETPFVIQMRPGSVYRLAVHSAAGVEELVLNCDAFP